MHLQMMKPLMEQTIKPKFVKLIPRNLEAGILYISIAYGVAIHKCPCGCCAIVTTPISPSDWHMTWNGKAVTLKPSIGNFHLQCKSHYFIIENKIVLARTLRKGF